MDAGPVSGRCPRCGAAIVAAPDSSGLVTCGTCGARLRVAAPGSQPPAAPPQGAPAGAAPTAAPVRPAAPAARPATDAGRVPSPGFETVLAELRDLRRMQAEILQLQAQILSVLRAMSPAGSTATSPSPLEPAGLWPAPADAAPTAAAPPAPEETAPAAMPRVRQRRKTVLIVDDDPATGGAAVAALERAQVPVRSAADGNTALGAIAAQKPDVLVLEVDLGEPLPGRDFINLVKATMEWIDIPIVLYTRQPIASQEEARTLHGADHYVLKGPGADEALVTRVIRLFQQPR